MMNDLYISTYNPDVLSCIANLSSDEVFTPPDVANAMLDILPQELFADPNTTFLDPAVKSGVFLREIAKRLLKGLESTIPDLQARIDHIFQKQLFGIAMTELTSLLGRRSLYCSKYPNSIYSVTRFAAAQGNIRYQNVQHRWANGKCVFCGASESEYGGRKREGRESHAYELIHTTRPEEIFGMKFDVIIGNPPYQLSTGGGSDRQVAARQATPLFQKFVEQAKKLQPRYLSMIIPARWYNGGIGLDTFRKEMLNDRRLTTLIDFPNSKDCFDGVDIAGGICYFLWERDAQKDCSVTNVIGNTKTTTIRKLNEFNELFIRSNDAISIIHKVRTKANEFINEIVQPIDAFGFPSKARGADSPFPCCVSLIHSKGTGYITLADVKKNKDIVDKYKVTISILVPCNGEVGVDPAKGYRSITIPKILGPGEVTTFSYLVIGVFDTKAEAENYKKYMLCKFSRFMLRLTFSSMHISKQSFALVPKLDFTRSWTDNELYDLFNLDEQERTVIEKTMRAMDDLATYDE